MRINYEENTKIIEKKSVRITSFLHIFSGLLLLLSIITMMIWCFYHDVRVVSGESMQPTINNDFSATKNQFDVVIINKTQNIKRKDIVIIDFSPYHVDDELIIKRVIAVAGDSIKIVWNLEKNKADVYLKQKGEQEFCLLDEPYTQNNEHNIPPKNHCAQSFLEGSTSGKYNSYKWNGYVLNDDGSITIQDGYFFAMGDNREMSLDSSEVGPFRVEHVIGVTETIEHNGSFANKLIRKIFNLGLNKAQ